MTRKTLSFNDLFAEYDYVDRFCENRAIVCKNNRYGFVERLGEDQYEELVKPIYVRAHEYIGGYAQVVNEERKYLFLNNKGEECFNEEEKYFYEGAKI